MITRGTGQDVDTVDVGGEPVLTNGQILNVDEDAPRATAPGIVQSMPRAATERAPLGRTAESLPHD